MFEKTHDVLQRISKNLHIRIASPVLLDISCKIKAGDKDYIKGKN